MATLSRRPVSSFNLSFLDVMFCGFGAVVLLVLLINSNIVTNQQEAVEDRRLEFMKEELVASQMRNSDSQLQQNAQTLKKETELLAEQESALAAENRSLSSSIDDTNTTIQSQTDIQILQQELKALEQEKLQLEAQKVQQSEAGKQVRRFVGQGDRQYLTGLKLGGKRILILVDSSASMLDRKIVDIIRLKVLAESRRRSAPKWQKTIATVEWLLAKLPGSSSVQLYHFNTDVRSLAVNQKKSWLSISDKPEIDGVVTSLQQIAPAGGTNLESALLLARATVPKPDNIILLTDGLPTQGKSTSRAKTISGKQRVRLFEKAIKQLPDNIPVNTILFPVEGDPLAAVLYWKLAVESGGSFLTPTRDWP